ncbi:hypothetical protein [Kosakonia radicincitans]|uniref:hypothetical protein n=1 Tax=Kosakonia radicincitans TaxID=283686 RepID=UPI0012DD74F7|nr:hypothetical protein [Kosakonia radicincitans]
MNRVSVYSTGSCSNQTREGGARVLTEQDGLQNRYRVHLPEHNLETMRNPGVD